MITTQFNTMNVKINIEAAKWIHRLPAHRIDVAVDYQPTGLARMCCKILPPALSPRIRCRKAGTGLKWIMRVSRAHMSSQGVHLVLVFIRMSAQIVTDQLAEQFLSLAAGFTCWLRLVVGNIMIGLIPCVRQWRCRIFCTAFHRL